MSNITQGIIAGVIFGLASAVPMFFMSFEDKTKAITASFLNRFAIGFIIFNIDLPLANWITGLIAGFMLSLPEALITNAYKPILAMGTVGGLICGLFAGWL
jgi:hypothetical protein